MCAFVQCKIYSVTSSSSFFVSSSIRRMSSIVRSIHLSIEQKSCLWKFANKRSSIWTEGEHRLDKNYNNKYKNHQKDMSSIVWHIKSEQINIHQCRYSYICHQNAIKSYFPLVAKKNICHTSCIFFSTVPCSPNHLNSTVTNL